MKKIIHMYVIIKELKSQYELKSLEEIVFSIKFAQFIQV